MYHESEKQLRLYKIETLSKIEGNNDDLNEQIIATNSFASELSTVLNNEIAEVRKQAYD
jgi:hypothetical protein